MFACNRENTEGIKRRPEAVETSLQLDDVGLAWGFTKASRYADRLHMPEATSPLSEKHLDRPRSTA